MNKKDLVGIVNYWELQAEIADQRPCEQPRVVECRARAAEMLAEIAFMEMKAT